MSALPPPRSATIGDCVQAAAAATGVPYSAITGRSRVGSVTRARQMAAWLARQCTVASLPAIGRVLRRDHTTVLHSVRVARDLLAHDAAFAARAQAARDALFSLRRAKETT